MEVNAEQRLKELEQLNESQGSALQDEVRPTSDAHRQISAKY